MKRLIPYILAYLIVATCTAIYPHIYQHFHPPIRMPLHYAVVALNPGMSQAEFLAKLQQVGLSVAHLDTTPPETFLSLAYHFSFDAVMLSAFAGLAILFKHSFRADTPRHADAA